MSQKRSSGGVPPGGAPPVFGLVVRGVLALVALIAIVGALLWWRDRPAVPARPDLDSALGRTSAEVGTRAPDTLTPALSLEGEGVGAEGETASSDDNVASQYGDPAESIDPTQDGNPPRDGAQETIERPLPTVPAGRAPQVAVVIDDLGRSVEELERFAALGIPLSYAVLPFETRTRDVVDWLRQRGEEILCHLPMEPEGGSDPGPGALYRSMSPSELVAATQRAIAQVPGAVGANNHMGSGLSAEPEAMRAVLGVLQDRGLFYLDSRTTAATVGYAEARALGVPTARRHVFLDNDRDPQAIRAQLVSLLDIAAETGSAIGIAHPYPETTDVLGDEVEAAIARGFRFVTASALIDRVGGRTNSPPGGAVE